MKMSRMIHPALAGALASLHANNAPLLQRNFAASPAALDEFEQAWWQHAVCHYDYNDNDKSIMDQKDLFVAVAHVGLRRKVYPVLAKFSATPTPEQVKDALVQTILPPSLSEQLVQRRRERYNDESSPPPPQTWKDELEYLRALSKTMQQQHPSKDENDSDNPTEWLWREVLNHPMTEYTPVHCPQCGHVVPDAYSPQSTTSQAQADEKVGLVEKDVTHQAELLELRSGWFRGPRGPVQFEITCAQCGHVYHWYRSGHPRVLLTPNRGRLCGDQEDLRMALAQYLGVAVRVAVPLDWDHVWTEFRVHDHPHGEWQVDDGSARNFACRLDEGIGSWTGVLAIHSQANLCQDVTPDYLKPRNQGGRADNHVDPQKLQGEYTRRVQQARADPMFRATQAGTGVGFLLHRAGLSSEQITGILRRAATDYRDKVPWWSIDY